MHFFDLFVQDAVRVGDGLTVVEGEGTAIEAHALGAVDMLLLEGENVVAAIFFEVVEGDDIALWVADVELVGLRFGAGAFGPAGLFDAVTYGFPSTLLRTGSIENRRALPLLASRWTSSTLPEDPAFSSYLSLSKTVCDTFSVTSWSRLPVAS
ncbi:MAG: hypothetical protein AAF438_21255 [Pseudomonadota bacterium]